MAPSSRDRIIVMIEQRATTTLSAFDVLNSTINSIAKPQCFLTASRARIER